MIDRSIYYWKKKLNYCNWINWSVLWEVVRKVVASWGFFYVGSFVFSTAIAFKTKDKTAIFLVAHDSDGRTVWLLFYRVDWLGTSLLARDCLIFDHLGATLLPGNFTSELFNIVFSLSIIEILNKFCQFVICIKLAHLGKHLLGRFVNVVMRHCIFFVGIFFIRLLICFFVLHGLRLINKLDSFLFLLLGILLLSFILNLALFFGWYNLWIFSL